MKFARATLGRTGIFFVSEHLHFPTVCQSLFHFSHSEKWKAKAHGTPKHDRVSIEAQDCRANCTKCTCSAYEDFKYEFKHGSSGKEDSRDSICILYGKSNNFTRATAWRGWFEPLLTGHTFFVLDVCEPANPANDRKEAHTKQKEWHAILQLQVKNTCD